MRRLVDRSKFFRALVTNCELSLVRSDIEVAGQYAALADRDAQQIYTLIAAAHARTLHALHDTLCSRTSRSRRCAAAPAPAPPIS